MSFLGSISNITNSASTLSSFANKAIVKPANYQGINGYVFDGIDFEEIGLESDITDHYLENNTAIQDHIALKPEKITVKGYVGEVVSSENNNVIPYFPNINSKIQLLSDYFPKYTSQSQTIYNQLQNTYQSVMQVKQTANDFYNKFFKGNDIATVDTKQSKIFNFFYQMWQNRQIFNVETYAKTFENMAILNMNYAQIGDQKMMSEVSITFKQIRFAITPNIVDKTDKYFQESTDTKNLGNSKPSVNHDSFLYTTYIKPFSK
jgi:hypothetical protein